MATLLKICYASFSERSLQYGSQILPVPKEAELAMKYAPEKSFQVIGVVPQDSVSHSLFMKVACF